MTRVAYITSSSFSGSTLLSFVLNAHSALGTISEYDVMAGIQENLDYKCSCGAAIRECKFFSELTRRMRSKGYEFSVDNMNMMFNITSNEKLNRYLTQKLPFVQSSSMENLRESLLKLIPPYAGFMEQMHRRNDEFMTQILDLQKADIFVDANKNPHRIKRLAEHHQVTPIFLFKNGIAGAYSFYSKAQKFGYKMNFRQACEKWFIEQQTIARIITEVCADDYVILGYSEFCDNPQLAAEKIFQKLDIGIEKVADFANFEHHIVGNMMRISAINGIKETKPWLDNISSEQQRIYMNVYDKYMPELVHFNPVFEKAIYSY